MSRVICGVLSLDGTPADRAPVAEMLEAMRPAAAGWTSGRAVSGPLALGAASASPSGTPAPAQIVETGAGMLAGDITLYGDGETATVGQAAARTVAELFADRGVAGAGTLHGDFAMAWWDRALERLTLLRDPFGLRPLVYVHRPGRWLAFASHPRALLNTGLARRRLDPEGVVGTAVNFQPTAPCTLFAEIRSLEPGHLLDTCKRGPGLPTRFWSLDPGEPLPLGSDARALAEEVRRLTEQAVHRRLVPGAPVVTHASGGLDSSAIAVIAARARAGETVHGYGFVEDPLPVGQRAIDETPYLDALERATPGIVIRRVAPPDPLHMLRGSIEGETGLETGPGAPESHALADARTLGAPVILTGWGGDQMVTSPGQGAYAELFRAGEWRRLAHELDPAGDSGWLLALARMRGAVLMPLLPTRLAQALRRLRRGEHGFSARLRAVSSILRPEWRGFLGSRTLPEPCDSRAARLEQIHSLGATGRLERYAFCGLPHGISYRAPLLDHDLLAFAIRVPGIFFTRGLTPRRLFRDAMEDILPDVVRLRRQKLAPFPAMAYRHASARGELLAAVAEVVGHPLVARFVDTDAVIGAFRALPPPDEALAALRAGIASGDQAAETLAGLPEMLHLLGVLAAQPSEGA